MCWKWTVGLGLSCLVATAPLCASPPHPLPLDVAFSPREPPRHGRPSLSPDGRFFAHEIYTPSERKPGEADPFNGRVLPSGLPANYLGFSLHLLNLESGASRSLCSAPVTCWKPSFSPDGKLLAYFSDEGGTVHLWLHDLARGSSRKLSGARIKAKLWNGDEAAFSPDGREVFVPIVPQEVPAAPETAEVGKAAATTATSRVTVHGREGEVETAADEENLAALNAHFKRENLATFAAIDTTTGAVREVLPATADPAPSCLRLSPDGRSLTYLSVARSPDANAFTQVFDLAVVPVTGGKPRVVATDLEMPEGDYYGGSYRITPDSRSLVFLKGRRLWITDLAPAEPHPPRPLAHELGELLEAPLLLTEDGRAAVVALATEENAEVAGSLPRGLAIVPLNGGRARTLGVAGDPIRRDASTVWQGAPDLLHLVTTDLARAERSIERLDLRTGERRALRTERGQVAVVGVTPGAQTVVARFEGLAVPPNYFRFDDAFATKTRLTTIEPRHEGVAIGPLETFETVIPLYNGGLRSVTANIFLPAGAQRGDRLPTLVYFYGGAAYSRLAQSFGGGAPNTIPVQLFASRGYAVLLVDVPLTPEGQAGNPAQEMVDAILPQVYRAAELGYTDIHRVAIIGQSYGGYGTAALLAESRLFRAGIAVAGVFDLAGGYGAFTSVGSYNSAWSETGQGRMGTHPWANLKRYIDNSPYFQADRIRTPLLLLHGRDDRVCPVEEAEKMYAALARLGRPVELAIYEGEGHSPGRWALANAVDAAERMLAFLERSFSPPKGDSP